MAPNFMSLEGMPQQPPQIQPQFSVTCPCVFVLKTFFLFVSVFLSQNPLKSVTEIQCNTHTQAIIKKSKTAKGYYPNNDGI